jgi:hypothetical protein
MESSSRAKTRAMDMQTHREDQTMEMDEGLF